MINIVVALADEARPLIDNFKLKRLHGKHAFPLYSSERINLIVSGIGAISSSIATGYLAGINFSNNRETTGSWVNIGVAGCKSFEVGSAYLARQVVDDVGKKNFYPALMFGFPFSSAEIVTSKDVVTDYKAEKIYDMEAAGFYAAASRFNTVELIHCIKIISDNAESTVDNVDRKLVNQVVGDNLPLIENVVDYLENTESVLGKSENDKLIQVFDELTASMHFTFNQKNQLKKKLNHWYSLASEDPKFLIQKREGNSAKALLAVLDVELEKLPVNYSAY